MKSTVRMYDYTHTKAVLDGVTKNLRSKVLSFNSHSNDSSEIIEAETHIGTHCMKNHWEPITIQC